MKIWFAGGRGACMLKQQHHNIFSTRCDSNCPTHAKGRVSIQRRKIGGKGGGSLMDNWTCSFRSACDMRLSSLGECHHGIPNRDPCISGYSPSSNAS